MNNLLFIKRDNYFDGKIPRCSFMNIGGLATILYLTRVGVTCYRLISMPFGLI